MLDDTKKRIESSIQIDSDKGDTKLSPPFVTIIPEVIIGNPAKMIIDVADNNQKVDLIMMGSTGLKGISKVCENAKCPVMLVH